MIMVILSILLSAKTVYSKALWVNPNIKESKKRAVTPEIRKKKILIRGNLPDYAKVTSSKGIRIKNISTVTDHSTYIMKKISLGDTFKILIEGVINAIEGERTKVSGSILDGPLIGSKVIGYARLETNSKKILIEFNSLSTEGDKTFSISSKGLHKGSSLISPTKYITPSNSRNLIGYVLSAFGSSLLESKIQVNQSLFGNIQSNDIKSSSYMAGSKGVRVITDRFKEALENSKDIAYITENRIYEINFLSSPKITIN